MDTLKTIWYLEKIDLYHILCPYKYDRYIGNHALAEYNKNDFIFLPDDIVTDIFLIAAGKVKIGFYDEEGNEMVLAYLEKGEIMGEMAYLGKQRCREFAQAVQPQTKICRMSAEKARELSRDYVPFALSLHTRIADRMLMLERRLEILLYKDVRHRLWELIHYFKEVYPCESGQDWIRHGLTQLEMAGLIGASRKAVSLLLNQLEKEGKLELANGKFKILAS